MGGAPSAEGNSNEGFWPDSPELDGSDLESNDGSFFQLSQASHLFHLAFLGDDHVPGSTEPVSFVDRPDIDDAMVDALRRAMVHEGGLPDPLRAGPVRNDRFDIDSALVEALARATIAEPEFRDG
ncbi:MAG TPA: hypothetical protein VNG12_13805 [Acidimicrobiales bacterium]|nr:hypothetical protein [Acidimicrobiales bacterium]